MPYQHTATRGTGGSTALKQRTGLSSVKVTVRYYGATWIARVVGGCDFQASCTSDWPRAVKRAAAKFFGLDPSNEAHTRDLVLAVTAKPSHMQAGSVQVTLATRQETPLLPGLGVAQ